MNFLKCTGIVFLVFGIGLWGCDTNPTGKDAAPKGTSVRIVSMSPSNSTALKVGDTVELKVEVEYTFSGSNGNLALVVQTADNTLIAQDMEVVLKGSEKTTFEVSFVVPNTKTIAVFAPISAEGQMKTSTVDMKAFKVVGNQ
jgi:hypothetical protein